MFSFNPADLLLIRTLSWCENTLISLAATLKRNTIGDIVSLYMGGIGFITEEHHRRVEETGSEVSIFYIGPWYLTSYLGQIVVASGKEATLKQLVDHGEADEDNLDLAARQPIKEELEHVFGDNNPAGMSLPEAKKHRTLIRRHLGRNLDELHLYSRHCLKDCIDQWDQGHSYQDLMTYLSINIIAKFLTGIPHVPMEYSPLFRQFEKLLYEGKTKTIEFSELLDQLTEMNEKLTTQYADEMLLAKKYPINLLPEGFDSGSYTQEEILHLLIQTKTGLGLFTGGNLAMLIMGAIVYISQNEPVKQHLREELATVNDWESIKELKKLPYLRCVLLECLRLLSPVTIFPRKTSTPFTLHTEDRNYDIPKNSYLFAAVREGNNNPHAWPNPRKFDPSRFEGEKFSQYSPTLMGDYFAPFSVGQRSCPAADTIVPTIFNAIIGEFFRHHDLTLLNQNLIKLDIPVSAPAARWHDDFQAQLVEYELSQDLRLKSG